MAATFDSVKLQYTDREDTNLYNILTARLIKYNVKRVILSTHVKGIQLYKEFVDEKLRKDSTVSIWAPLKKARLKRMKNRNTKAHYVTDGKLQQLERHCDLFRTIAVLNTVPGSNINIKEIIENYECSSLTRSLFDVSDSPNHGGDRKLFGTCSLQFHRWCIRGEMN